MIKAFWSCPLGQLPAVIRVSPLTITGALVPADSLVLQTFLPVSALKPCSVPSKVVVKTTSLAMVAPPYGEEPSLLSPLTAPVASSTATKSPVPVLGGANVTAPKDCAL